jgi:3-oxoadipate enol-lactonase
MPIAPISRELSLYYEEHGDRDQPTVVLIRGTGADSSRWMPQVEAYRDEYHVIIFDNRGVGRSSTPTGPYTVAEMAADTLALMDFLDVPTFNLSGSSLGGAIALDLALRTPHRTTTVQMHSSWLGTRGYVKYTLGLLRSLLDLGGVDFYYEATLPLLFSVEFLSSDFDRTQQILARMHANPASIEGLRGQLEANLSYDLSATAGELSVPTLVTVGSQDLLLPVSASRELVEAIPGAELIIFDDAAHLASMEQADAFNRSTMEWMRQHCA